MTAPTLPAVLREAAALLPGPTLTDAHLAILHAVQADAACPDWPADAGTVLRVVETAWDLFEAREARDGWPRFRTVDGLSAYMCTTAAAIEIELARELEHACRRHPVTECQSCGAPSTTVLCAACQQPISADAYRLALSTTDTPGSAR